MGQAGLVFLTTNILHGPGGISTDGISYFPILVDFIALAISPVIFMVAAIMIHEKVLTRRLT